MQRTFVQFPSPARFRVLAQEFEALHKIPYIIKAIDGSHIPIFVPIIGEDDYYCIKSFHSALLQCIVDTKCTFWDYEFGWGGSLHVWTLFQLTKVGKDCIKDKFLPYKFIGNCACLVWPWIYSLFKGCAKDLQSYNENLEFHSKFHSHVYKTCFRNLKRQMANYYKKSWYIITVYSKYNYYMYCTTQYVYYWKWQIWYEIDRRSRLKIE